MLKKKGWVVSGVVTCISKRSFIIIKLIYKHLQVFAVTNILKRRSVEKKRRRIFRQAGLVISRDIDLATAKKRVNRSIEETEAIIGEK